MRVLIKGAGDLASGIAVRLYHCGFQVIMTEIARPTTVRRTVAFSDAVTHKTTTVEDITAEFAASEEEALRILSEGKIPVLCDPEGKCRSWLQPEILVDAVMAKVNAGTAISDAPTVIAIGPGYTAGTDCHAVIETMRGHTLGRPIYEGAAIPNTRIPGLIGGYTFERILRAPSKGVFRGAVSIGDKVEAGDITGWVGELPVRAQISGVVRGLLDDGVETFEGMKAGDVDPRGVQSYCYSVSDKALAIAGGVLEAILHLRSDLIQ